VGETHPKGCIHPLVLSFHASRPFSPLLLPQLIALLLSMHAQRLEPPIVHHSLAGTSEDVKRLVHPLSASSARPVRPPRPNPVEVDPSARRRCVCGNAGREVEQGRERAEIDRVPNGARVDAPKMTWNDGANGRGKCRSRR
jgi:hypothetical protein